VFALGGLRAQEIEALSNAPAIKRLDASIFTAAEIEGRFHPSYERREITGRAKYSAILK